MKASYCTNVFSITGIPEALRILKEIGYDGVEFWHDYLVSTDAYEVKAMVDHLGLEISQICPYFNVTGSKQELAETFRTAEQYIKYAQIFDCKLIRTFTGKVSSCVADEAIYRQAVDGLRTICDLGTDKGIMFVLETHEGSLMDTSSATLRLINDVGKENLKVNLQVPLDSGKEDVYKSAEMLGEHVVHLHAHNWIGGWPNLTFLGEGDYDFVKFIRSLVSKGFDGYISIEHGDHIGRREPYAVARHEIRYLMHEVYSQILFTKDTCQNKIP